MAKAKKLPSGNWRVKVFSHTTPDGKNHYESFTASTKQEAEMRAAKFASNRNRSACGKMALKNCIEGYITTKKDTLEPSSIRGYRNLQKKYYKELEDKDINKITNADVQNMLNSLKGKVSTKTIKNIYSLFTASVKFYSKDIVFNVTLPKDNNPDNITIEDYEEETLPTNEEIRLLYRMASPWLKKCIALAAFSGMRRGEVAGLRFKDIIPEENRIFVHSAFSMDEDNNWLLKTPKTEGSIRFVNVPKEVIELLGEGNPEDYVIGYNPNTISKMFGKLRDRMQIKVRFHDLRHYYATIGKELNVPDTIVADFGGWEHNSPVMKKIYMGSIKDIKDGYAKKMNNYFSDVISGNA